MSDKSVLGPDASWVSAFWRVCPDVVVEVMSEDETWPMMMRKINSFTKNGTRYAVAIDPEKRRVYELGTIPFGLRLNFDMIFDA